MLRSFKHPEFWEGVQAVGMPLSLIHDGEAASDVKEQESRKVRTTNETMLGADWFMCLVHPALISRVVPLP